MLWMLMLFNLMAGADEMPISDVAQAHAEVIVDAILPQATQKSADKIILENGFRYTITPEEVHPYGSELNGLTISELDKFYKRRREILLQLAKILSYGKLGNGLGHVENDKLSLLKDGTILGTHPLDALAAAETDNPNAKITDAQKISRRHQLLAKILNGADRFFFQNSKTAVTSNEFGIDMALSLGSVIGAPGKYILGGAVGIQLDIGFDRTSKKINFQLKLFYEKATRGITGVFMPIGITPRIGGYMRASATAPQAYEILYTPLAPAYIAKNNGMATLGATAAITPLGVMSAGTLAFLESAMSYEGKTRAITIIDSEKIRIKYHQVYDFIRAYKTSFVLRHKPASCGRLFAH